MSMRYKGGVISATAPITSASIATGVWTLEQQLQAIAGSGWPGPSLGFIGWLGSNSYSCYARSVEIDSAGNMYVCGIENTSTGLIETAKYSSNGVIQWQQDLRASVGANGYGYGVAVDSSGNVYVVGADYNSGSGFVLAKYNSSGTIQWARRLGGSNYNSANAYSINIDTSNNIYICGSSNTVSSNDFQVAKYDTSGAIQWQIKFNDSVSSTEDGYIIKTDSSGNIYFCGYNSSLGTSSVVKCNSSGVIQWQRKLSQASTNIYATALAVDSSGNVYVGGQGASTAAYLLKYNNSGTLQWQVKIGFSYSQFFGLTTDSSGNVYAAGYVLIGGTNQNLLIIKYNSSGVLQWQRMLASGTGANADQAYSITTDNASIYVAGFSEFSARGYFLFAKLPTDGSGTGTYSVGGIQYVYSASSEFELSSSITDDANSLTASSSSLTDTSFSYTAATSTLTSNVTTI